MQITFDQVSYSYGKGTPFEKEALSDISLTIPSGTYVGIIGQTGSGKSTLIQHLNGILKPSVGLVKIGDWEIGPSTKLPSEFRKLVGLVFQYPEHQLFEETVEKDVAFGPLNYGSDRQTALHRAREALNLVGLPFEEVKDRSPFQLSGGQMRRVAIAGVLAVHPEILVLDEPTAGLDPAGRKAILEGIYQIHRERKMTTLLVTHSMEEAARYADLLIVMANGRVEMLGTPEEVFSRTARLRELALDVPETVALVARLNRLLPVEKQLPYNLYREEDLAAYLLDRLTGGREYTCE